MTAQRDLEAAAYCTYVVESVSEGRRHIVAACAQVTESGALIFCDSDGGLICALARGEWTVCRRQNQ